MKKCTVAIATLVAAGGVMAQSSVTIWGIVDAAVSYGSGSVANKNQLINSGLLPSQLGFRGVEDLGNGMRAGFWLEGWVNNDNGTGQATNTNNQTTGSTVAGGLTFNRRSTVSLGGNWGELRLGRDYTPQFWNLAVYDPFNNVGVGTTQTLGSSLAFAQGGGTGPAARASNSISYIYNQGFNNLAVGGAGFHALAMYYMGENASNAANSNDGTGYGVRLGYIGGPVTVALGLGQTTYATGDIQQQNVGATYNFGVAKLIAQLTRDQFSTFTGNGYLVGATVPAGPGYARVAYSHYRNSLPGEASTGKLALGYVYGLSKRTSLYGTLAQVTNDGGAAVSLSGSVTAPNQSSSGFDVGMMHSF